MTVRDVYRGANTNDIVSLEKGQEYLFAFSWFENSSIEVYEVLDIDGNEVPVLASVTSYEIIPRGRTDRYPIKRTGTIRFTRDHPSNAVRVLIQRNTLIDQTIDFPSVRIFNPRQIEIAADKATHIAQELAARKCRADVGDLDMRQMVTITQYDDLRGETIQFMLDKITAILWAIDQTAEDCRDRPEDT